MFFAMRCMNVLPVFFVSSRLMLKKVVGRGMKWRRMHHRIKMEALLVSGKETPSMSIQVF